MVKTLGIPSLLYFQKNQWCFLVCGALVSVAHSPGTSATWGTAPGPLRTEAEVCAVWSGRMYTDISYTTNYICKFPI